MFEGKSSKGLETDAKRKRSESGGRARSCGKQKKEGWVYSHMAHKGRSRSQPSEGPSSTLKSWRNFQACLQLKVPPSSLFQARRLLSRTSQATARWQPSAGLADLAMNSNHVGINRCKKERGAGGWGLVPFRDKRRRSQETSEAEWG